MTADLVSRALLSQTESYFDGRDHFHRLTIQQGRFVNPLPDGFHRGAHQQRMTADELQIPDSAILADGANQANNARDSG